MPPSAPLRPAPPPREVNTRLLVVVGTALFLAAYLVLLAVDVPPIWRQTALAGWVLGIVGFGIMALQTRARRRTSSRQ